MATVELRFSPLPAHVRTARLVTTAVARRSGVDEALLDEVRLAVGEACSRAVYLHRQHCPDEPVLVVVDDDRAVFRVTVHDRAPLDGEGELGPAGEFDLADLGAATSLDQSAQDGQSPDGTPAEHLPPPIGLAILRGLVDDLSVRFGAEGAVVAMTWSSPA
jgi:anti-sigma regulatory factor (Ser/Thr protein kinase)